MTFEHNETSTIRPVQVVNVPYLHPSVPFSALQSNGTLLSDEEKRELAALVKTGRFPVGKYEASEFHELPGLSALKYPIVKLDKQCLVVYEATIGKGGFGAVSLAQDIDTGSWFAIKQVQVDSEKGVEQHHIEDEADRMNQAGQFRGMVPRGMIDKRETYDFVMELAIGTNLTKLKKRTMPAVRWVDLGVGAMLAIDEVHEKGMLHRDIKGENLHYDAETGRVTPIDWGFAIDYPGNTKEEKDVLLGTPAFLAPELLEQDKNKSNLGIVTYNEKTEVYALGIALAKMYKLASLKVDVRGGLDAMNMYSVKLVSQDSAAYKKNKLLPNPDTRAAIYKLLEDMTNPDPNLRLGLSESIERMHKIRSRLLDLPSKIIRVGYLDFIAYEKASQKEKAVMRKELLSTDKVYLVDTREEDNTQRYMELKQQLASEGISMVNQVVKSKQEHIAEDIANFSKQREGNLDICQNFYITSDTKVDQNKMNEHGIIAVIATPTIKQKHLVMRGDLKVTDAHFAKAINSLLEEKIRLEKKYANANDEVEDSFAKKRIAAIDKSLNEIQQIRFRNKGISYNALLNSLDNLQKQMNKKEDKKYSFLLQKFGLTKSKSKKRIEKTSKEIGKEIPRQKK